MKPFLSLVFVLVARHLAAQQPTVVQTDSSRIETTLYPGGREVREIVTRKDRVHYRFYRNNTAQVTTTATYTKAGRIIGTSRYYDDQGHFRYAIDHDHGRWLVANPKMYRYYALRSKMKAKADSLIAALYGPDFLRHHVIWNVQGSAIYNAAVGGNWTDQFGQPPTEFLFRYDVKLDAHHVYPELIQFQLDAHGKFIPNPYEAVSGFEQVPAAARRGFALQYAAAIAVARQKSDSTQQPLQGFLTWECWKRPQLYNGQFRFYVPVKTGTTNDLHPQGRSRVTQHYDVYSFNPWTGVFLGKQRMKAVREWEQNSGSSFGLQPDP